MFLLWEKICRGFDAKFQDRSFFKTKILRVSYSSLLDQSQLRVIFENVCKTWACALLITRECVCNMWAWAYIVEHIPSLSHIASLSDFPFFSKKGFSCFLYFKRLFKMICVNSFDFEFLKYHEKLDLFLLLQVLLSFKLFLQKGFVGCVENTPILYRYIIYCLLHYHFKCQKNVWHETDLTIILEFFSNFKKKVVVVNLSLEIECGLFLKKTWGAAFMQNIRKHIREENDSLND